LPSHALPRLAVFKTGQSIAELCFGCAFFGDHPASLQTLAVLPQWFCVSPLFFATAEITAAVLGSFVFDHGGKLLWQVCGLL
jgi:hypothetical protein